MTSRPERTRLRRAAGAVLVTALLAGAVVLHRVADELPTTPAASDAAPGHEPRTKPRTRPGPRPGTDDGVPGERPPAGLPQRGPGVTEPGILLVARPNPDGTLDVGEWVLLPAATTSIGLTPPEIASVRTTFLGLAPYASALRVRSEGRPVPLADDLVDLVDGPTTLPLPASTRSYELRYLLHDAAVASRPTSAGRALAAYAPLSSAVPDDLPVVLAAYGSAVRKLLCPWSADPGARCDVGTPPLRRVDGAVPRQDAVVVMKYDLGGTG